MEELLTALARAGLDAPHFTADEAEAISDAAGAYALLVRLDRAVEIALPGTRPVRLEPGWFAYCGSARGPGGMRARLRRHMRRDKALHWHVDRLTIEAAGIVAVPFAEGDECRLVAALLDGGDFEVAAAGFGSTDCRACDSHLLRFGR